MHVEALLIDLGIGFSKVLRSFLKKVNIVSEYIKNKSRWYHNLSFKIMVCQVVFILLMILATITIMITLERSALREKSYDFIDQMGNKIISDLGEQISMTESLTTSLANIGEVVESDENTCKTLIPHVIEYKGYENLIAGGGCGRNLTPLILNLKEGVFSGAEIVQAV